jgi:hypothetical protein
MNGFLHSQVRVVPIPLVRAREPGASAKALILRLLLLFGDGSAARECCRRGVIAAFVQA